MRFLSTVMRKINVFVWKRRREKMWVAKMGSACEKIGRAGLYAAV